MSYLHVNVMLKRFENNITRVNWDNWDNWDIDPQPITDQNNMTRVYWYNWFPTRSQILCLLYNVCNVFNVYNTICDQLDLNIPIIPIIPIERSAGVGSHVVTVRHG
jgi:hypothetical protein